MSERVEPLQLGSFEREAQEFLRRAEAKAREILQQALSEAKSIRERAREEGTRLGAQQGEQKGLDEGRKRGAAEAAEAERRRVEEKTAPLADLFRKAAEGVEARRRDLAASAERELVQLAMAVAARVIQREVSVDPTIAVENVKRAIALCASRQILEVRLNPDDRTAVEEFLPRLRQAFVEISSIQLIPDEAVARGGCVVATREGNVDADISTQLQEIQRQLLS